MGVFPDRATKSPGKLTKAALPTWHPAQFICRGWYFLRLHAHFRRKNNLGDNAKVALRADSWSAMGPARVRGQLLRENNNGKTEREAASPTLCSGVALFRLFGGVRRGTTRRRRCRRSALLDFFADVTLVRPRA